MTRKSREVLSAHRDYFVSPDGSDQTGDGLSPGSSFRSINAAIAAVSALDLNGLEVFIQVGDGRYDRPVSVSSPFVGGGRVTIRGNPKHPENVLIDIENGRCFLVENHASIALRDLELRSKNGAGIFCHNSACVFFSGIRFGLCYGAHLDALYASNIIAIGDYSIVGGGGAHLHAHNRGQICTSGVTCHVLNDPEFPAYFCGVASSAVVQSIGTKFTGRARGRRYLVHNNGFIDLGNIGGPPDFFPGDRPGFANAGTGGVYDYVDQLSPRLNAAEQAVRDLTARLDALERRRRS